ncbi:MAG: SpoIIE family protein phosphatase [Bacteroidetes bacterium]|nr:SpoIIE family protein phosphatase [Bacteroidota bacterium]
MPSSIVYDIKTDKYNRIWIATFGGGIACYDGIKFKVINADNGLNNDLIRNIALDEKNNRIFVGSQGAFEVITRDSVINLSKILNDSINSNVLLTTVVGNTVYASTQDGLVTMVDLKKQSVERKTIPVCFLIDNENNQWLPNRNNLFIKLANGNWIDYKKDKGLDIIGILDITKYKNYILVATRNGIYVFDKLNLVKVINQKSGLRKDHVRCMLADNNTLWLGTRNGLVNTTDLENFNDFDSKNGIDECDIKCMSLDKNGLLWVGSGSNGVFKMIKSDIIKYNFSAEPITFASDSKKNIYALTKNSIKIYNKDSNNFINYLSLPGFDNFRHFCFDKNNAIYLTVGEKGVLKYTTTKKTFFDYKFSRTDNPSMTLLNDDEFIWFGFKRGLLKYNITTNKIDTITGKVHANYFQDILKKESAVWLATGDGLTKYDENKFTEVSKRTTKNFPDGIINSIEVDKYKHIWIAADRGLFCYEGKETFSNYRKDGFPNNEIWDIAIVDTFLFAATNKGLIQVAIKPKHNKNCIYQVINKRNGLIDFDLTDKAIFSDSTYVWIAHENGAYRYKPSNQLKMEIPIYISNIYNDNESLVFRKSKNFTNQIVDPSIPLELYFKDNAFTIEFKGVNYNLLDNVFYSYRLIGFNANWSIPSNETKAVYANLNPGKYVFELSASNGKINFGEIVSYTINIKPPFYLTWWFKTLIGIIILMVVYSIILFRTRNIKLQNAVLEQKVTHRTKQLNLKSVELEKSNNELLQKDKLITESLEYAKKIQESILPSQEYLDKQFDKIVKTSAIYLPKDIVSGDFFYTYKGDKYNYFALVDCTGHGVPGALLSFSVNSILHGIIDNLNEFKEPSSILKKLLEGFSEIYIKDQDVKESFAISLIGYRQDLKKIYFSGISQSISILSDEELKEIKGQNSFLIYNKSNFIDTQLEVKKGDRIYFYSDGYYDQKSEADNRRMYKSGLNKQIVATKNLPLHKQVASLKEHFINFKGNKEQIDDVALFVVEVV